MADKNHISNIIFIIIGLAVIGLLLNQRAEYKKSMTEVKNRIRVLEELEVERLMEEKGKLEAEIEERKEERKVEKDKFMAKKRRIELEIERIREETRVLKEKLKKRQKEDIGSSIKGDGGIVQQETSVTTTE